MTASLEAKIIQQFMDMREEVLYKILLDLHKAYDALDRDRCLNILVAYGVELLALRLLTMVSWAKGYFGTPFKGYRGVTQGDPLSPTIYNLVVYAVLRHWVAMVERAEEAVELGADDMEVFRRDVQQLAACFYADDGLFASTQAACLQRDFDALEELLNPMRIHTNVAKTAIMVCQHFCALGGHSAEAYGLRMAGEGQHYQ